MTCENCPHLRQIKKALAPCQTCEGGKLHHQVSMNANPGLLNDEAKERMMRRASETSRVTCLPPETEDALRYALMRLFDYNPLELLLIQHVVKGGTYSSFNRPINAIIERVRRKGYDLRDGATSFRATVKTWADKIVDAYPPIGQLFAANVSENAGLPGRIAAMHLDDGASHQDDFFDD